MPHFLPPEVPALSSNDQWPEAIPESVTGDTPSSSVPLDQRLDVTRPADRKEQEVTQRSILKNHAHSAAQFNCVEHETLTNEIAAIGGSIQFATFFVSDYPSVLSAAALKRPPGSRHGFSWNQFEKRQLGLLLADQISIRAALKSAR